MEGCCLPDKRQASLALLRLTSGCLYELVRVLGEWLPSGSVWHRLSPVKLLRVAVLGVYYKVGPLLLGPFIVMTYSQAGIVRRRVETARVFSASLSVYQMMTGSVLVIVADVCFPCLRRQLANAEDRFGP